MQIKRYMFAALLLMAGVWYYVQKMVSDGAYSLEIFGVHVTLPIAVWAIVPMGLLFLASIFHMAYYGFKAYMRRRRVSKDVEKLADALFWAILKSPKKHNYFDKRIKPVGAVLDNGCDDFSHLEKNRVHDVVRDAIDIVGAVNHGEVLDLSKYKLEKSNPFVIRNHLNMLQKEPERAEEVLRRAPYYDAKVLKEAMLIFVESANENDIDRFGELMDKAVLMRLLESLGARQEKGTLPSLGAIERWIEKIGPDGRDYMRIAGKLTKFYSPNELLAFFERLSAKDDKAFKAYLLTLLEFEMLDRANELLQDTHADEYLEFKAYLDLRKTGKHYPIDLLLQTC